MGGIPVHVTGWSVDERAFEDLVGRYRREVLRLEAQMSVYRANSLLSRANEAHGEPVLFDPDTAAVVAEALALAKETHGAFDPTVRPFIALWKQAEESGRVPDHGDLARVGQQVGAGRVHLSPPNADGSRELRIEPGTALDVGGIAKGYFADVGLALLREAGVKRALVEIGGDLSAYDDRERPEPFRIGVRHPFSRSDLLGVLTFDRGSVVTSGDYERGFQIGRKRYNHIIDPRTGRPTESLHSVTLVAPNGARADGLATAIMVLGEQEGLAFVEARPELEAVLVVGDRDAPSGWRTVVSSGLKDRFRSYLRSDSSAAIERLRISSASAVSRTPRRTILPR